KPSASLPVVQPGQPMFCQTSAIRQQTKACFVCRWGAIQESHIETVLGKTLCTYVQEHGVIRPATVRTYLLKQWKLRLYEVWQSLQFRKIPTPSVRRCW